MKQYLLLFILLVCTLFLKAQVHENHSHHTYHFGFGFNGAFVSGTSGIVPGFHIHVLKQLNHFEKWQIGIGYENMMADKIHHSINIPVGYNITEHLVLKVGPGFSLEKEDAKTELILSGHIECIYEFEFNKLHLGPLIGLGFDKHDSHIGLGVHAGFGF